jgi:hypothetical protein
MIILVIFISIFFIIFMAPENNIKPIFACEHFLRSAVAGRASSHVSSLVFLFESVKKNMVRSRRLTPLCSRATQKRR